MKQIGTLGLDALIELQYLVDADQPGLLIGFQQGERSQLQVQVVLTIPKLLKLLKQADESPDVPSTAAGSQSATSSAARTAPADAKAGAAKTGCCTDTPETATARAGESGEPRSAKKAASTPGTACATPVSDRHLRVEALSVELKSTQICQQSSFCDRQLLQGYGSSTRT